MDLIVDKLREWIDNREIDAVITTGGTGVTGRDVTPEALARVQEKDIPGFENCFVGSATKRLKPRRSNLGPALE